MFILLRYGYNLDCRWLTELSIPSLLYQGERKIFENLQNATMVS